MHHRPCMHGAGMIESRTSDLSAPATDAVAVFIALLLMGLLAGGLLWHWRRRKISAETRRRHMFARESMGLTDWTRGSWKTDVTNSSRKIVHNVHVCTSRHC